MPKDINTARWGNPYQTSFAGAELISAAGNFGRSFREQGLVNRVEDYSEETMYMADQQRRSANQGDLYSDPNQRLQQVTTARASEVFDGGEQGLIEAEKEIGTRAFRSFKRYKDAVDQGASNNAAARISIEKEMRDMIRQNPGFANVISNAAQQAMTSTEFQLLTRDPDAVKQVNNELTPFQKFQMDLSEQLDFIGEAEGWSQDAKDAVFNEQSMLYIRTEALGRAVAIADDSETLTDKQVGQFAQAELVRVSADIENLIMTSGILEGDIIPQERVTELKKWFSTERRDAINEFIKRTSSKGASGSAIDEGVRRISEKYDAIDALLEDNSAHYLLQTYAETGKAGSYVALSEFLPIYTMFSDVYGGDNASFMVNSIFNPKSGEAQFAFENSPVLKALSDRADSLNMTTSDKMNFIAGEITKSGERYFTRNVLSDPSPEDREAAKAIAGAATELKGENRKSFEDASKIGNLARIGDPLFTEYLLNSSELSQENVNLIERVYKPAIESTTKYAHDMARSFEEEGAESYVLASMDEGGTVSLNVVKYIDDDRLYVYPVVDESRGATNSYNAMNALSVYDTANYGKQSMLSGITKDNLIGKGVDPRSYINGQLLFMNNNKPTPKWITESKDPKVNGLFRDARRFQDVYRGL